MKLRAYIEKSAIEVGLAREVWNSFNCSIGDFVIAVIRTYASKSDEQADKVAKELGLKAVVCSKMDEKGNVTYTAKVVYGSDAN